MRAAGLGLKAATITPEGRDDVGSPNRIIREGIDGTVIVRTGRRIPGVTPVAGVHHPISICRMAVGDAYGAKQWREGPEGSEDEVAFRTERISRRVCRAVSEHSFRTAAQLEAKVYGGPKWTVSPVYEGMLKEEMDAAAERHPEIPYEPVLIDATYAGLISGAADMPLVIPTLNRDGDLLSDLVMPMFGSIAGAESVLLSLDAELRPAVAMAEAPHGTAPALEGKDIANPMAMILACAAVLHYAGERGHEGAEAASRAMYDATLEAAGDGIRTHDLGGEAGTTEVCDEVAARVRAKLA
jgi:isocitrate/isopropylmalate dehydrogenase